MDWAKVEQLTGRSEPFRPEPGESLESAWSRCPDARWMLAVAIEAGARPRQVIRAIVACARELLPGLDDRPPWRGLLHVCDAHGRGEMDADAVRQLVGRTPSGRLSAEWCEALGAAAADQTDFEVRPFAELSANALHLALHPDTEPRDRVVAASRATELLARLAGLRARSEAHAAGAAMLEQHRVTAGPGFPTLLPPVDSAAWEEAARAGYAHALARCAHRVRALVRPPWAAPPGVSGR